MSNASVIREWLATQDGPRTVGEIREGTGLTKHKCNGAVHDMTKAGILARSGSPFVYTVAREVAPKTRMSADERRRRNAIATVKWRRANRSSRTREEWLAEVRANAKPKVKRDPADVKAARQRGMAKAREKRIEQQRARLSATVKAMKPAANKPEPVQAQTVEEFLAMGGKVERLETKQLARPIGYVGWSDNYGVAA